MAFYSASEDGKLHGSTGSAILIRGQSANGLTLPELAYSSFRSNEE